MKQWIIDSWLNEDNDPAPQGQSGQSPMPGAQPQPPQQQPQEMQPQQPPQQQNQHPQEVEEPETPDIPEIKAKKSYETWHKEFMKASLRGDAGELIDMLMQVADRNLSSPQDKFIKDNLNIQLYRQNSDIAKASKDIRKNIKDRLDKNNPSTSLISHITSVLDTVPQLYEVYLKIKAYGGYKGELHRAFMAALLGAVQVSSGAKDTSDLVYADKEYTVNISTKCNSDWGFVPLGNWDVRTDDSDKYLEKPELQRLRHGSPEEKDVLRRRIIMESICDKFKERAYIINVINEEGTICHLGIDLDSCIKGGYTDGKIVIKTKISEESRAMITDEGKIVSFLDTHIYLTRDTGEQNNDGSPEVEELPFIENRNGGLFLTASLKTLKLAASTLQGVILKETPYNGNPSDLKVISKCAYTIHDLLVKKCL